jgi:N-acetylneuraminate synthase
MQSLKKIFIIGEIGINHNGDLKICEDLIVQAKKSGCDAVKFQKRNIEIVYTKEYLNSKRESPWGDTQRDQKQGLEFDFDGYTKINKICKNVGIEWFASAWDLDSQDFLKNFETKYNKIASPMIIYKKLLKKVASEKKHTFISTGMCEMSDIEDAVKIFREEKCPFELMHCVSTYPMKPEDANLKMINVLKDKFECDVGYSGHESGLAISVAAASLGISSLERHITLDRSMYGSDQSASVEPNGLKNLIDQIRKIEKAMGNGVKVFSDEEKLNAKKLRQHIL